MIVSLILSNSESNAWGEVRCALEGGHVCSKSPSGIQDRDKKVAWRNGKDKCSPDPMIYLCALPSIWLLASSWFKQCLLNAQNQAIHWSFSCQDQFLTEALIDETSITLGKAYWKRKSIMVFMSNTKGCSHILMDDPRLRFMVDGGDPISLTLLMLTWRLGR